MTREKEIKRRLFEISTSNFNNSVVDSSAYFAGYIDGARWADNTMINKACEWLRVELDKEEELHYIHVHGFDKERRGTFLEDFKQAMKGE